MTDKIIEEILKVRDTGRTNMFDIYGVQRVAYEKELFDLVIYLEDKDNWGEYTHFIITGETK